MILLYEVPRVVRWWLPGTRAKGMNSYYLMGKVSVWTVEKYLERVVMIIQQCECN